VRTNWAWTAPNARTAFGMEPRDCEDGLQPKAEPVPESAYPRIITRRSLLICCVIGYIPIIAAIFLLMPFARRHHPVGTPIALAPVFCFLTYSHVVAAGMWMRRPLSRVDLVRIGLWGVVGIGIGMVFDPLSSDRASSALAGELRAVGMAVAGFTFGVIVLTVLIYPNPRRYADQACPRCGYDQSGRRIRFMSRMWHADMRLKIPSSLR
jgi:hypothetical protein